MKWLFYLAVLLNIAYLGYNLSYNNSLIIPETSLSQNSDKSIVLLDEVSNIPTEQTDSAHSTRSADITNAEKNPNILSSEISVSETNNKDEHDKLPEQQDNTPLVTGIEIITKEELDKPTQEIASDSQSTAQLNKTENQAKQKKGLNTVSNSAATRHKVSTSCFKLGPFKKQELDKIKLELETLYTNRISFGIETTSKITYYRIYIPPLKSRQIRNEALAHLDQNGMTDHYVMSIDGRKNAIALGVFKKREAAEKVAVRANKLGFSTTIEAISDDKNSLYNLQLVLQTNEELDSLNNLIKKNKLKLAECDK